jgi:DcaP outer membrane protein
MSFVRLRSLVLSVTVLAMMAAPAAAQNAPAKPKFDVYGFAQLDFGFQIDRINPDWYDVMRPTKLPASEDEFGTDGNAFMSARQSRFGVQSWVPTSAGELSTVFEFDMFGVGDDAGQTTIRLRKAYGQLGKFGAGQTNSAFMDIDVFPNTLEYWGPNGMIFFRNLQVRYMPIQGESFLTIALENPGASADQGDYADRVELTGVEAKFPLPDLTAQYRSGHDWGYIQLGGIVRRVEWEDNNADAFDLSGDATGWGFSLSSNIKIQKDVIRLQGVYGEGIQNYMNDAPVDIGIQNNFSDPVSPIIGVALPMWSVVAFWDHTWSDKWTSSLGGSYLEIDNSDGQSADAFHSGTYAAINLIYYPVPNVLAGIEYTYGQRENFADDWSYNDNRIAVSFKYSFKQTFGGN